MLANVVGTGLVLAAIGIAGALATVRLWRSFLWDVQPTDPLTFAAVAGALLLVAIVATTVPALRGLRLDQALTLRAE